MVIAVGALVGGCGSPTLGDPKRADGTEVVIPQDAGTSPSSVAEERVFDGTPEEYVMASRACWDAAGYATKDPEPGSLSGYSIEASGHTDDEFADQQKACASEVGRLDMPALSEDDVRLSYERRVELFGCLSEKGLAQGTTPSWETFRDNWRAGAPWEPLSDALAAATTVTSANEITAACPRTFDSW